MSEVHYGLIVEGQYDQEIIPELVRKVLPSAVVARTLPLGGRSNLAKLRGYLNYLQHALKGGPVDKVLVVQDCDQRPLERVENELDDVLRPWKSRFPRKVHACGIRNAIESWLLVDASAINAVAQARETRGRQVGEIMEDVEEIVDPKTRFKRILSEAGLEYTPKVCAEIASRIPLERLRARCQSFRSFERKVLDC